MVYTKVSEDKSLMRTGCFHQTDLQVRHCSYKLELEHQRWRQPLQEHKSASPWVKMARRFGLLATHETNVSPMISEPQIQRSQQQKNELT